jgi:PKD repeat protein
MPLYGLSAQDRELHYLVVDRSGSIGSESHLEVPITTAVKNYVNSLPESCELRVVFFNDSAAGRNSWSPMNLDNKIAFINYFTKNFRPGGQTRLYDTIAEVIAEVSSCSRDYKDIKVMILSDGEDTASKKNKGWGAVETAAGELKKDNANAFIIWYTLGFKPSSSGLPKTDAIIVRDIPNPKDGIQIDPPPVAEFEAFPLIVESGQIVKMFVLPSPGKINEVAWDFGDGTTDKKQRTEHQYKELGKFSVTLHVKGPGGTNAVTKTNLIQVVATVPVKALFTWKPETVRIGEEVQLIDKSEGQPTEYDWSLGKYGTSKERVPVFIPDELGKIEVKLSVHRGSEADSAIKVLDVIPQPPTADFSVSPGLEIEKGQTLSVGAVETDSALSHEWVIGTTSTNGSSVEWKASDSGMVDILHRVKGPGGTAAKSKSVYVKEPPVLPPFNCDFTISPAEVQVGGEVVIVCKETDKTCEHIWIVGGKKFTGSEVKLKAAQIGSQTVTHEIAGKRGGKLEKTFMVLELLPPEINVSPMSGKYPLEVECKDKTKGVVVGRTWDFGDGTSAKDENPVKHTYTKAGQYRVNLTIRNAAGREASLAKPVFVTVKAPLPAWIKWVVIGGVLLAILLVVFLKIKPESVSGFLAWEFNGQKGKAELYGTKFSFSELKIAGWEPKKQYSIRKKGDVKLYSDNVESKTLDKRKQFNLDGASFTYTNDLLG